MHNNASKRIASLQDYSVSEPSRSKQRRMRRSLRRMIEGCSYRARITGTGLVTSMERRVVRLDTISAAATSHQGLGLGYCRHSRNTIAGPSGLKVISGLPDCVKQIRV
ncbi:unnamed protein product [Ceratitis capitata]|uniref:(Mediterranean fruit fly) hypothetical protein n=1 Tax=Ceratitis capitata TaxID=7213 RepID=A0A811UTM9_CERCA|nr:unnamed protein product [Ceratitis capitata]